MSKNTGLNLELEKAHRKETDALLGGRKKECAALIPNQMRHQYLPFGEIQNLGEEKMDCVSRAYANNLETKLNYLVQSNLLSDGHLKFLKDYDFLTSSGVVVSDAYIAIESGTTRDGNSLIAPIHAIHKKGLVPKSLMPQLLTFDEYHDPNRITSQVEKIAGYFMELFDIEYERVLEEDFPTFLVKDMIVVGGYAWPTPIKGIYPRVGATPNHAYLDFTLPQYLAFDNYPDAWDGDFIKQLAEDYDQTDFGYRTIVTVKPYKKITAVPELKKKSWFKRLLEAIKEIGHALYEGVPY